MNMNFWGFVFFSMAATSLVTIMLGVLRNPRWYWAAVVTSWIASILGAFSIGLYTLVVTLVTLALAIGYSLGLVKRFHHALVAVVIGVGAWAVLVPMVDDLILFYPLHTVLDLISGGQSSSGSGTGNAPTIIRTQNTVLRDNKVRNDPPRVIAVSRPPSGSFTDRISI
jgi:hypothetical protein